MKPDLTLTLVQTKLHWEQKELNLQMLNEKISGIIEKTELVILPEMFSTGFSMKPELLAETMEGETVQWMRATAATHKIILAGSVIIKSPDPVMQGSVKYYNRLIWMQPDGNCYWYDKRHLFSLAGEAQHYTAGNNRVIVSVNGWKINLQICYDLRFPLWARQASPSMNKEDPIPEYDVLVYVANWPEKRNQAWKTLLQARAIENQCYVAGVNRVGKDGNGVYHSGDSLIIDPAGEILYSISDEEEVFTLSLSTAHHQTIRQQLPFLKDSDNFVILKTP